MDRGATDFGEGATDFGDFGGPEYGHGYGYGGGPPLYGTYGKHINPPRLI